MPPPEGPIVLFDGVCNMCSHIVQFIVDHERVEGARLRFAPLQSDRAKALLEESFGADRARQLRDGASGNGDPDTMVLVEDGRGFTHSSAALRITRYLRMPWRWLFAFIILPAALRDVGYRFVARNRYRWFGKAETCRVPTPELRARFLA